MAGGDTEIQSSFSYINDETFIKNIDSFSFEVPSYNEHIKEISKLGILPPKQWAKRNERDESSVLYKYLEVLIYKFGGTLEHQEN